jgi:hypothetical protein
MKIGMSGSRDGISELAIIALKNLDFFNKDTIKQVHHGDCIGADTIFHNIASELDIPIIIHPPSDNKLRSFCKSNNVRPEKSYLKRNQDIVTETDILIAFPSSNEEIIRSGTWSTIRYARKKDKIIYIIFPNGKIKQE